MSARTVPAMLTSRIERALVRPWLLVVLIAAVIGLPVLATGELGARDAQDRLHHTAIAATGEAALRAAEAIDLRLGLVKDALARANTLALYLAVSGHDASAATDLITAGLGQGQSTLGLVQAYTTRNAWIVDATGRTLATVKGVGVALPSVNGRPLLDRAAKSTTGIGTSRNAIFVTDNVRFEQPFVIESPLAVAPLGDGVTFAGALIVQIHTSAFGDDLKAQLGTVEDLVIFDAVGRLVSRAVVPDANYTDLSGTSVVAQALAGTVVRGDAEDPLGGGQRIVAVAPVSDSGWRVAAIVGPTAAERDLADSLAQQRTVRLALVALLIVGSYLFARVLSGSIRRRGALAESLERETATRQVLQVISRSAFDIDAVFRAMLTRAIHICDADWGTIERVDGDDLALALQVGGPPSFAEARRRHPAGPGEDKLSGRVLKSRRPVQIIDAQREFPRQTIPADWYRTVLLVPMLRNDEVVGAIGLYRFDIAVTQMSYAGRSSGIAGITLSGGLPLTKPAMSVREVPRGTALRPFTDREIQLVETFADQAAIAIENVRLFNEIQDKSRQLEVASKHKSEFLANMSHELRTPLNAIIGFADVLGQKMFGELNPKQSDYLADIGTSGRHLLDLVNQILDLSKVEAGRMELEPSAFAPGETIRASLAFVRDRAAAHRIQVAAEIPTDLPTVTADERKIRQVLLNLLSNAVKFTPDGGWIGVTARARGGQLEVAVKDTGIGIALADQATVFEEFRQVGQPSDRSREGSGLGLALAKRFVELHGGRIWVESEPGTGSTFTFAIPVERPATVVAV